MSTPSWECPERESPKLSRISQRGVGSIGNNIVPALTIDATVVVVVVVDVGAPSRNAGSLAVAAMGSCDGSGADAPAPMGTTSPTTSAAATAPIDARDRPPR